MKKQYLPEAFSKGELYRLTYKDAKGVKTKRDVLVTSTQSSQAHSLYAMCLERKALRQFTIANIKKAKNITSKLKG